MGANRNYWGRDSRPLLTIYPNHRASAIVFLLSYILEQMTTRPKCEGCKMKESKKYFIDSIVPGSGIRRGLYDVLWRSWDGKLFHLYHSYLCFICLERLYPRYKLGKPLRSISALGTFEFVHPEAEDMEFLIINKSDAPLSPSSHPPQQSSSLPPS